MQIRAVTSEDIDTLRELQRSAHGEAWSCEVWSVELNRSNSVCWLVETEDGVAVAFLVMWRVLDVLEVVDLVVAAEYRRRGIATALMETAMSLASSMGVRRTVLEVRDDDEGAYRFYEGLGFVEVEFVPGFYDDGTGARRLGRNLVAHSDQS